MPLHSYGVLKGKAIEVRVGAGQSPHYQVRLVDDTIDYRIAINVKSQLSPSDLEFIVLERYEHPITGLVEGLGLGFTRLPSGPGTGALDFIRGNLFDRTKMRPLPFSQPGFDNDLNEKIDRVMQRAVGDERALVYAFGERWGPEPGKKDKYFGFTPGNGIHDIHMNQGNSGGFVGDDGVYQDGGMLLHFPHSSQWIGIFLKFQSQAWHTDDRTGHTLPGEPAPGPGPAPAPIPAPSPGPGPFEPGTPPTDQMPDGAVRIVAALVNAEVSPEAEFVTLLNTTNKTIALQGWHIADRDKNKQALGGSLPAGETLRVKLQPPVVLPNKGGLITVLNAKGLRVDGVSYTAEQAKLPGFTLKF